MPWQKAYYDFGINEKIIWLNNCGVAPLNSATKRTMHEYLDAYEAECIEADKFAYDEVRAGIKRKLSQLIGCGEDEVVLIHNTAEGMNFISYGYPFEPDDEIVVLANEYPSNVYPWRRLKSQGVKLTMFETGKSSEECLENFRAVISSQTRMASLSAVHWLSGFILPLKELGQICSEKNITFVIDGAQGVGHVPVDVKACKIAYMPFSAWKWLLGPLGLGAMFIDRKSLDKLEPVFMSTGSVVDDETYLPYRDELKPDAERYNYSTPNYLDWVYFNASLDYLNEFGFDEVMRRISVLGQTLKETLLTLGFSLAANRPTAGILVARHEKVDSERIVEGLKEKGIIAALREGCVRFSPHIYISEQQLERVHDVLKALIR